MTDNSIQTTSGLPPKWHLVNGLLALRDTAVLTFGILILPGMLFVVFGWREAVSFNAELGIKYTQPVIILILGYMAFRVTKRTLNKQRKAVQSESPVKLPAGFYVANVIIGFILPLVLSFLLMLPASILSGLITTCLSQNPSSFLAQLLSLTVSIVTGGLVVSKRTEKRISMESCKEPAETLDN